MFGSRGRRAKKGLSLEGGGPLEYKTRDEVISGKVNRGKVSQGKGLKGSTKRGEEEEPEV